MWHLTVTVQLAIKRFLGRIDARTGLSALTSDEDTGGRG